MTRAHIDVSLTMSLEEAVALELHLAAHVGQEPENVKALRLALSRQLGLAERTLMFSAAVA